MVEEAIIKFVQARIRRTQVSSATGYQLFKLWNGSVGSKGRGYDDWMDARYADLCRPMLYLNEYEVWLLCAFYQGSAGYRQPRKGSGGKEAGERTAQYPTIKQIARSRGVTQKVIKRQLATARNKVAKYYREKRSGKTHN